MHSNEFVTYLNRYTTVSSDHEAAFDEFVTQFHPVGFAKLRLETKVADFVRKAFNRPNPPSIILTGNAGDGKTYLCRQIIEEFTHHPLTDWSETPDLRIQHTGQKLRVIKDFSEMEESHCQRVLGELNRLITDSNSQTVFLIAANEGRLRAVLGHESLKNLREIVFQQLEEGTNGEHQHLVLINLNNVATSAFVGQVLDWITQPNHWASCNHSESDLPCIIRENAHRLRVPYIKERVRFLYEILEHLGIHVTIRDMLIHLAYTVTGGRSCNEISDFSRQKSLQPYEIAYYQNILGESADPAFRRKSVVMRHLRRLNLGKYSYFRMDDFIVNSHNREVATQSEGLDPLASGQIDLGMNLFQDERDIYLRSGKSSSDGNDPALLSWLPHCRRKLFFELPDPSLTNHLFTFTYLPLYFELLNGTSQARESCKRALILGLNRAFTNLYIINSDYLYITSQSTQSGEQPTSLIKFRIGYDNILLRTKDPINISTGEYTTPLYLEIHPPPRVLADPINWSLDLLKFEYLMRRSEGSTADILAGECELAIYQFKADLLHRFGSTTASDQELQFFAPTGNEYTIHTLQIKA